MTTSEPERRAANSTTTAHRVGLLALCIGVAIWWWPAGAYWQSDDFIAVHYAADASRAFSDFFHNQYDLQGVVWFYRPLVTLSFWLEQFLAGGPSPALAHAVNLALHLGAMLLVAALGTRLWNRRTGALAALCWASIPAHAGVVWWTVGRVDSLATLFMLAAALLFQRRLDDDRRGNAGWIACFALALASKESALALPAALCALAVVTGRDGDRLRRALRAWPSLVVLALYFIVRRLALGRFLGGYDDASLSAVDSISGLGAAVFHVVAPLWDTRSDGWKWLALLPLAALAIRSLTARRRFDPAIAPLVAALLIVALAVPALPLWSQLAQPMNQRLLYVAMVPFALWCGRCGVITTALFLLAWGQPQMVMTSTQREVWDETRHLHHALDDVTTDPQSTPVFVAGLPRSDRSGRFVSFHLGVDRLLQPPFRTTDPRRTFALRPLAQRDDAIRLPYGSAEGLPFDDPTLVEFGATTGDVIVALPPIHVPDLALEYDGPAVIASSSFLDLDQHRMVARVHAPAVTAPLLRVTLFTAGGYLSTILPNAARADEKGSAFDITTFLRARYVTTQAADNAHVLFALSIATTFDLDLHFPMLVEAGALEKDATGTAVFFPHAANHTPLWLTFDRGVAAFLAGG